MKKKELCDFQVELESREHNVIIREEDVMEREQTLLAQEESIDKARHVMSRLQDVECHVQDKMAILQRVYLLLVYFCYVSILYCYSAKSPGILLHNGVMPLLCVVDKHRRNDKMYVVRLLLGHQNLCNIAKTS